MRSTRPHVIGVTDLMSSETSLLSALHEKKRKNRGRDELRNSGVGRIHSDPETHSRHTSSGRVESGGYTVILKHTQDTQDLVTATDSEVLCYLVW
jgi:hypothetical protein